MKEKNTPDNAKKVNVKPRGKFDGFYEWVEAVIYAFLAIFIIFAFCFRIVGVDGDSMNNTLNNGDWLVISNFDYSPERQDVVVITQPNVKHEPLIKRVIGVAGDTVDIDFATGEVSVNGVVQEEPYIKDKTILQGDMFFPLTVPEGKVFVLGDNRNESWDSRFNAVGFIDERYLMGKAVMRIFPLGQWEVE